jgi:rhamnosyltransferase
MDQDSVVDRGLIQAYAAAVEEEPRRVCLAPRTIARDGRPARKSGATRYAITSGNLVAVGLFDQTGLYDEGFFIDCIDFDFSLRVRRAGVGVYRVAGALMQHEVGGDVRVPRLARIFYARHPAVRRYYMYRNFMYLAERYLLDFPVFIVKLGILQLVLLPFIGAFDTHPLRSYRAVAQGIWDYAARRTGAYEERLK